MLNLGFHLFKKNINNNNNMSYNPNEFVKLTYKDNIDIYTKHKYKEGLNIDIYPLSQDCYQKGGFHFCRFRDILRWFRKYYDCNIWRVKIPEGEKIIEYECQLKAHKIILWDCCRFYDNIKLTEMAVSVHPFALEWVENVTPQLCLLAVEHRDNKRIREYVKKFGLIDI